MATDERRGLPSASSYPRIVACPGFLQLQRTLPPGKDDDSEDARIGNRIHAALNGQTVTPPLTDDEQDMVDRCLVQFEALAEKLGFRNKDDLPSVHGERRFFISEKGADIFSGQIDRFEIMAGTGMAYDIELMIDWKTGRLEVEPSESNLQVRAYAVLLSSHHHVNKLYAAVIQPWVSSVPTVVEYSYDDLCKARRELLDNLARAEIPGAPRTPGDHCKYCPNLKAGICPEARGSTMTLATTSTNATGMSDEELAGFLDMIVLANQVIESVQEEAKRRLAAGQSLVSPDGNQWVLKPGAMQSEISKPETVYARCADVGVTYDGFLQAIKIQKGKLEDVLKAATTLKGQKLKEKLNEVLAGCVTEKQNAPSLSKAKAE